MAGAPVVSELKEWCPMSEDSESAGIALDRRQFLGQAGGLVLASTLGSYLFARSASASDEENSTKVGGTLKTFSWDGYADSNVAGPFLHANHVTLESAPITTTQEILTRLKAGGTNQFDLVSPICALTPLLVAAGVIQELDYSRIPNTKNYLPNVAPLGPETFAIHGKTYTAPFLWGLNALIFNKAAVPKTPTSWMDLTRPAYKGKLLILDNPNDNIRTWSQVLGYDPAKLTKKQLDEVTNFLIHLKKTNVRTFAQSFDDVADLLARGELWATASATWIAIPRLAKLKGGTGKNVTWTLPKEGGVTWTDGWVMTKDAPNPATAYAFLNFMLGARQQAALAQKLTSGTVVKGAVPLLSQEAREIYPYNDVASLEKRAPAVVYPSPSAEVQLSDWVKAWTRVQAA
jgi:spermidine/putrescine-binding protein